MTNNTYLLIDGDGYNDKIVGLFPSIETAAKAVARRKHFEGYVVEVIMGKAHAQYAASVDVHDGNLIIDPA